MPAVPRVLTLAAALALAAAYVLVVWTNWDLPRWWALLGLAVAVAAGESTAARIVIGRQGFSFSFSDAFIAVAFVLAPGAWIPLCVNVGNGVAFWQRRLPVDKSAFNLSAHGFSLAVGLAVTEHLGAGMGAAMVGIATFAVLAHLIVAMVVSASSGERYPRVLLTSAPLGLVHHVGNASIGFLAAWLALNQPVGLLGLVVPLALLVWSYRQQARRATEARLFEELARGRDKIAGQSVDSSAQIIVTTAARVFGGAEVEMVVRTPDGLVRYGGDEHGMQSRIRTESDVFGEPWVVRALGSQRVRFGHDGERPYCSAVMGDRQRPQAVLIARRPERAGSFDRGELRLTEMLVRQAESWLSVADLTARHDAARGEVEAYGAASRVLGELGAGTAPALVVLRESADRLSRLAHSMDGPDPVSDIVEELHSVEQAVASLLGAISLASGSPRRTPFGEDRTPSISASRADAEWTSTGRLDTILDR